MKFKLTSLLFLFSISIVAQKNEIKLNAAYLIAGIPEVGYEHLVNKESSIGIDLLFSIDGDNEIQFATTPYYRLYFGEKPNAGFFAEGFGMLNFSDARFGGYYDYFDVMEEPTTEADFALGVAIGGKFITTRGLTFELLFGVGRNLFNEKTIDAVPRFGVTFGKRF